MLESILKILVIFLIAFAFVLAGAVITKFLFWLRERDLQRQKAREPIKYILYTKDGKIVDLPKQKS